MAGGAGEGRAVALVVNGDDFGYSAAINAAIVRCHRAGVLTSATILVNRAATGEALALARANPALGPGLHLNLTEGAPVTPPGRVPALVDRQGLFHPIVIQLRRIANGRTPLAEVERELRAQFELILARGVQPTHVDGHLHVHAWARVLPLVARLMVDYGVRAMRSPFLTAWLPLHLAARPAAHAGLAPAPAAPSLLDRFCPLVTPWGGRVWSVRDGRGPDRRGPRAGLLRRRGVITTDFMLDSGQFLGTPDPAGALLAALRPLRAATVELMAHPAWNRDEGRGAAEVALLTDPRLRDALVGAGVRLTNYGRLRVEE